MVNMAAQYAKQARKYIINELSTVDEIIQKSEIKIKLLEKAVQQEPNNHDYLNKIVDLYEGLSQAYQTDKNVEKSQESILLKKEYQQKVINTINEKGKVLDEMVDVEMEMDYENKEKQDAKILYAKGIIQDIPSLEDGLDAVISAINTKIDYFKQATDLDRNNADYFVCTGQTLIYKATMLLEGNKRGKAKAAIEQCMDAYNEAEEIITNRITISTGNQRNKLEEQLLETRQNKEYASKIKQDANSTCFMDLDKFVSYLKNNEKNIRTVEYNFTTEVASETFNIAMIAGKSEEEKRSAAKHVIKVANLSLDDLGSYDSLNNFLVLYANTDKNKTNAYCVVPFDDVKAVSNYISRVVKVNIQPRVEE